MQSSVFHYDPATRSGILQLRSAPWVGRKWVCRLGVCASPFCACPGLEFACITAGSGGGPDETRHFSLHVFTREIYNEVNPAPSPESLAFAQAVADELTDADWRLLSDLFTKAKNKIIEAADVLHLDAHFPKEVMSGEVSMVGYAEIFPLAGAFSFAIGHDRWLADDQYCVNPGCRCREAVLTFVPIPAAGDVKGYDPSNETAALYEYRGGSFSLVAAPRKGQPAMDALFSALKEHHRDLDRHLERRHRQLKILYKRALARAGGAAPAGPGLGHSPAPRAQRTEEKPPIKAGRNDPCPCGSGKKYKKCCGS